MVRNLRGQWAAVRRRRRDRWRECAYWNCHVPVPPGGGTVHAYALFCSEACASEDQVDGDL